MKTSKMQMKQLGEIKMKFPYLYAWHKMTGSYDYYIINLGYEAMNDFAPRTALYKDGESWRTYDSLLEITKERLKAYM